MRETKILCQESYKDLRQFLEDLADSSGKVCYCKNLEGLAMDQHDLRTSIKSAQIDGIILYQNYKTSGYLQIAPPDQKHKNWRILCYRVSDYQAAEQFKVLLRAAIRRVQSQGASSLTFVDGSGCQDMAGSHEVLAELGFSKQEKDSLWTIHLAYAN